MLRANGGATASSGRQTSPSVPNSWNNNPSSNRRYSALLYYPLLAASLLLLSILALALLSSPSKWPLFDTDKIAEDPQLPPKKVAHLLKDDKMEAKLKEKEKMIVKGKNKGTKEEQKWRSYTLKQAVQRVASPDERSVIVCAVSQPYLPFLSNWLISMGRKRQENVLVIAEDYATLFSVNKWWPGHAVLVPPAPDLQIAHRFGSQGFYNFTSRRPSHLLQILELGYSVLYNDVDMVWLKDPFPYFKGNYDIYFTDDMAKVKPKDHSHALPPPGKNGRTYICSCMLFFRPTEGAKLVVRKWIEEMKAQPWSPKAKNNDQPSFNWALNKTDGQAKVYLLPQYGFPSGGLYFKNETWRKETEGQNVIVHNNYILGFEKKIKRFRDFNLWFAEDRADKSPIKIEPIKIEPLKIQPSIV